VTINDDRHIYQTIGGHAFKTSLGGGITERAIGGILMHVMPLEDSGWWFMRRSEFHIAGDVVVPDIAAWRHERMPYIPDVEFFEVAPDWVLEIVTSETARLVRIQKLPLYARWGVEYVWLVDPMIRTLEVFRFVDGLWRLIVVHGGDQLPRAEPFESVELKLPCLWIPE
jgi:Uma2 family endonuclease